MSELRFFATDLDAYNAGIPLLDVGTDQDLGGYLNPIIRLVGRDEAGGSLFDHAALALTGDDVRVLLRALTVAEDTGTLSGATRAELRGLEQRLMRMQVYLGVRDRLGRIIQALGADEQLILHDGTRVICVGEYPRQYRVSQRDTPGDESILADGVDWRTALDRALGDRV